jgi:hypothetical protein
MSVKPFGGVTKEIPMRPDNRLLQSAYLTRADLLLKRVLVFTGVAVLGIALYVALGLGVGA